MLATSIKHHPQQLMLASNKAFNYETYCRCSSVAQSAHDYECDVICSELAGLCGALHENIALHEDLTQQPPK